MAGRTPGLGGNAPIGDAGNMKGPRALHKGLDEQGIKRVYYECTAQEWLT